MESTFKSNVSIGAPKMSTRKSAASAADSDSLSMEALIPVINKLQDVFNTVGEAKILNLPQIVVVGSQSSGKSSVLENLVGKDFLPRGTGIVTRVPLVMQLTNVPSVAERSYSSKYPKAEEWAVFMHKGDSIMTDFDDVRNEIEARTVDIVGKEKNVADKPIHLRIYSPHVLNLTLVDLPGITKVAVADQPLDIEQQIRTLVLKYIENPNSIILAVSPANSDLANSDALKIAREVDPAGERTIGVCTKLDLMDRGTDASDMLNGKVVRVKLGMIGVVNRSQHDINEKKSIRSAVRAEAAFFKSKYPSLKHRCGTAYLAKNLNKLLLHNIRGCLPELRARIKEMRLSTEKLLSTLGNPECEQMDKGGMLLQFLTRFADNFKASIDGSSPDLSSESQHLSGGAMICDLFHNTFGQTLQNMHALDGLSPEDIRIAIRNATGTRPSLFVPELAFELLVKKQIRRLLDPGLRCIELVFQELERLMHQCASQELSRFRSLREQVLDAASEVLKKRMPETISMVESLISIEVAYINTNHRDFEGGAGAMAKLLTRLQSEFTAHTGIGDTVTSKFDGNGDGSGAAAGAGGGGGGGSAMAGNSAGPHGNSGLGAHGASAAGNTTVPMTPPPRGSAQAAAAAAAASQAQAGKPNFFASLLWGRGAGAGASPADVGNAAGMMSPMPQMLSSTMDDLCSPQGLPAWQSPGLDRTQAFTRTLTSREQVEVDLVTNLIESYYGIVRDKIVDSVPKAIMHFLVNYVKGALQNEMVTRLWKRELFDELLQEDPIVAAQRLKATEMLKALERATTILTEVSTF